jgi:serine/threonine-protein phosphatase 2B catalytic subunit
MHLQVPPTATNIPTDEQFFSKTKDKPDIAYLKDHFYREGRVKEEHALYIIEKATEILHTEPNLLDIDAPVIGQCVSHPLSPSSWLAFTMIQYSSI